MRLALLSFLLVAAPLSGCLSSDPNPAESSLNVDLDKLSDKLFEILPVEELWVEASDGKRLHTAVFRPDTNESVPVFINFSPYWGDTAELRGDAFGQYMIDEYVPRGYAVVLAAIRGTGHSEGCFQIAGDREIQDLYETIDYFASVDWSNGNVATGGKSYDSTPQNGLIAKMPHPALKAAFHVSGITDMYRYNYREGIPYASGPMFNTYYYLQGTDEYGVSFLSEPTPENLMSEDPESLARLIDDVACTELPQMQASGVGSGITGLKDDYWIERDWTRTIGDSQWEGGLFFVHGLQDWNVKPDHILPWLELLPDQIEVKGWLHQWTTPGSGGHVYPMRSDWNQTMLRWLDHYLKGIDTGLMAEPAFDVQSSDGYWRQSDAWPPADATNTTIALAENGPMCLDAGCSMQEVVLLEAGDEQLRYAGAPTVTLDVQIQSPDPWLNVQLFDESPTGDRTWVNEAVRRGIYPENLEAPATFAPGDVVQYTLEFYPQDDILEPGHKWVLVFGAGSRVALAKPTGIAVDNVEFYGPGDVFYRLDTAQVEIDLAATEPGHQPNHIKCFTC